MNKTHTQKKSNVWTNRNISQTSFENNPDAFGILPKSNGYHPVRDRNKIEAQRSEYK